LSVDEEPQVSWKVIEAGASVVTSDGTKAATVSRVVGDTDADVFTGLAVKAGVLREERLIPSERVRAIYPDRIEVDLTSSDVEHLPPFKETPVVRIEAGAPGFLARLFGRR
jgi:hypothetical protein